MATIERFEDIKAWQLARELCKLIHSFTLKPAFLKDYRLVGQIKGSSGSIMDNIAEGFERNGNREFIQFLSIAKGSSGELALSYIVPLIMNTLQKKNLIVHFKWQKNRAN